MQKRLERRNHALGVDVPLTFDGQLSIAGGDVPVPFGSELRTMSWPRPTAEGAPDPSRALC